jgi:hypothetical protein
VRDAAENRSVRLSQCALKNASDVSRKSETRRISIAAYASSNPPTPATQSGESGNLRSPGKSRAFPGLSGGPLPTETRNREFYASLARRRGPSLWSRFWNLRFRAAGELFSLHPTAPAARHDRRGLALSLSGGARVESIDSEGADIRTPGGARQRFYRSSKPSR